MATATVKTHKEPSPLHIAQPGQPVGRTGWNILQTKYPPMRYLIDDLIPYSFCTLAAPPKAGKSMFALWCALKVLVADPEVTVLCVSPDDTDEAGIQDRMNAMLGGENLDVTKRIEFWFEGVATMEDDALLAQIADYLTAHDKCCFVIIDVYNAVKSETSGNDIQRHDWREMNKIRQLGQRLDVAIMLLNHTSKKPGARFSRGAGSQGIGGGAQTIIELERDDYDKVTVALRGRRGGTRYTDFVLDDLTIDWMPVFDGETGDNATPEELQQEAELAVAEREEDERRRRPHVPGVIETKLLQILSNGRDWAPKALAEVAELRRTTVRSYLRRMLHRGQVEMVCGGLYRLVTATPATPATPNTKPETKPAGEPSATETPVASVASVATPHRPTKECFGHCLRRVEPAARENCDRCGHCRWRIVDDLYICQKCHPDWLATAMWAGTEVLKGASDDE